MRYQVREILLFGWTENFNTQAPEHCHIDFVKSVACCTNNKDVFLTVLRYHVRDAMIQYLRTLNEDLLELGEAEERQEGQDARHAVTFRIAMIPSHVIWAFATQRSSLSCLGIGIT